MATITEGGNGRTPRRNNNRETAPEPIHKTKEFKETVKQIVSGQYVAPVADPKERAPKFNIPIPNSPLRPQRRTGSSFDQDRYEKELEGAVRARVTREMPTTFAPGTSKKTVRDRIEKETKRLVDIIKRPRYTFLSDGTPFYLSKEDERADLERSLMGETPMKRRWMLAKYDVASGVGKIIRAVADPSMWSKEFITDEDATGNVAGALAQLGLNSAILGWEYLKVGNHSWRASEEEAARLEAQAEAVKYTDPASAQALLEAAGRVREQVEIKKVYHERVDLAGRAVDTAWANLFTEWDEAVEADKEARANLPQFATPDQITAYTREQRIKAEQQAAREAATLREQALQAYGGGDFEKAIELTGQAQEQDRKSSLADPYGAYTWIREPERYEKFKQDAVLLELQKGAPLTREELRRLKEVHVNSWTEITGEVIFDPINLIPAAALEKVVRVPARVASTVNKALVKTVPGYAKTINVLGSPVRWLRRQSVTAGANQVARNTYNVMERISNAYTSAEQVTKAIDEISDVVLNAKRGVNEQEMRAAFETGRKTVPGLQQITFRDFKNLMDSADFIDPTEWGKRYSDALTVAESNLMETVAKTGKATDDVVSEVSKNRWALEGFTENFYSAFKDPHRIYKGARLTDDTIAGWVTKTMRNLSGDEVNDMLKLTKFDEWAIKKGEKLGIRVKDTIKAGNRALEATLTFAAAVRDIWATTVLTTFRWPLNNLMDTSMRSVVYGGNLWDDMVTMFTSTQRTLADELGFSPIEFNQALSRQELKFTESVPHRLLYEGWKPKAGLFSYIGYEYKRLLVEHGDSAINKADLLSTLVGKLPDGALKSNMANILDGYNYRVNFLTALRAVPGGVSDFNTAIEFTFRLRMFHKEYFSLLKKLEPKFMERGLDALTPGTKEIAKQIWKAAEGNPRRITAYVDNLIGGNKGTPASWSFVVPPELEKTLKGMDIADQNLFISSVKNELDAFVETAARNGQDLKPEDFTKFFNDYKTKMQDEIQERLSQAHDFRDMDTGIRTDGKTNPVLTEDDIKGSMPIPKDVSPRNEQISKALEGLNRKGKRRSTIDITKDLETAISDYADVARVSGDGIRVRRVGPRLLVEVGDNALKKGQAKFYNQINEAVIGILKNQDTDLIKHSFADVDEYGRVMKDFFDDPTAVLNANEQQFITLVHQMENHPMLRQIIEQTSPQTVRKYDSAMDVYRDIGEYSDEYGFTKRPDMMFESEAQRNRPLPGSHIAAQSHNSVVTRQLAELGQGLPDTAAATKVREFLDNFMAFRRELNQFYSFTYPGPLMKSTTEGARHAGWDLYYRLGEAEFATESRIKEKVIDLLQNDPEEAARFLDDTNGNFAEWFLKENGIELEWDVDRQIIMRMKVKGLDGKIKNITARRDIANLQIRFFSPLTKKNLDGLKKIRLGKDPKLSMQKQLRNALGEVFQLPHKSQADAWAKVMVNHAEKWAQETGQPIEKYFERLGFQRVDSSSAKGLGTLDQTRIVKRGAIKRNDDGTFMFYGLSHSNFESMIRETGELFYDDLISMAEHSPQAADDLQALKTFLVEKTGKPIRANKLHTDHSKALADVFTSYVASGRGPNISVKGGFDRLKAWVTQTFDVVRDTPLAGEIGEDTYRVLDRLFIEAKISDVPKTNARTIREMAKEANLVTRDEEDILRVINDALAQPKLTPDELVEAQKLEDAVKSLEAERQAILNEGADLAGDNTMANATLGNDPRLVDLEAQLDNAKKQVDAYYLERTPAGRSYTDLGDVPKNVAAEILGVPQNSKVMTELQEGWDVWRTQRGLNAFPEEALADPDTFKAYLKQRMGEEWSEASDYYNRLLWEVEQFETAMLNFHQGSDLKSVVMPRVHEAQMSNGMKTFIRNQQQMVSNYEMARRALDQWGEFMGKMATDGHPVQLLTKDEQAALKAWAYGDGSKAKAEMVDTILHGADDMEGAIAKVNRVMLDYQNTNVTDQFMKNWFPFWMFPSRSFPFWAETLATHPQLIAAYEKMQALSRSHRYQAGAVTSRGKPIPSLDGYIKIPGTDTWFNPLAPFSFRYLLDIQKSQDDIIYAAQSGDDIDPKSFMAAELMQSSQIYGFTMGPWAAWGIKKAFGIPDEIIPRYPLIPEIQLIPRWWVQEQTQRATEINLFGWNWKGIADTIYPEVPWHDYMVERRILEDALQQIQSGKLTEADKLKLMNAAQNAIKNKDTDLWQQTYKDVTNEASTRSIASFFSGVYAKNFGDGEADLLALRNDLNMLKSALNNEFQANVFDLPVTADAGWENYLNQIDTPEGWVHRLYTDIGWVQNDKGELLRDPKERAYWLAQKIEMDEDQQMYYDKMSSLHDEFNKRLHALPIGASWDQTSIVYDWYSQERAKLDHLRTFEKFYGTNKPTELIQRDMASDWFREINGTRPQWDMKGGESYTDYQERVMEWEQSLPKIAATYMRMYATRTDIQKSLANLRPDQAFNTDQFFANLVEMTNKDGLEQYEKETDDIFDALNKAWKATYWDEYWNSVIGKSGYEVDLAESQFYAKHQNPPSADELYAWIEQHYGPGKFTPAEIKKYVDGTDELDILQRQLETKDDPEDYQKRQEIWDMLSWIGPGNKNRGVFDQAFANAGGDEDWLTTWYQEGGEAYKTKPERLEQMRAAIEEAVKSLGLEPPKRAELVRYVQAQNENDAFKQMVKSELGNQFFDYVDKDGLAQPGVYSYYNSLDYEAKKEFRSEFSEEYDAIQTYYQMKEIYAEEHLVWADYFGFDTEPSVSLPTNESGTTQTPPALRGIEPKRGGGGGGGKPEAQRPTQTQFNSGSYGNLDYPNFNIYDRTSSYVSPGLYQLVGNKLAYEITNLYSSGRRLSGPGASFLRTLASRYPQYNQEIQRILSKGS